MISSKSEKQILSKLEGIGSREHDFLAILLVINLLSSTAVVGLNWLNSHWIEGWLKRENRKGISGSVKESRFDRIVAILLEKKKIKKSSRQTITRWFSYLKIEVTHEQKPTRGNWEVFKQIVEIMKELGGNKFINFWRRRAVNSCNSNNCWCSVQFHLQVFKRGTTVKINPFDFQACVIII